jgi:hypothetical protein
MLNWKGFVMLSPEEIAHIKIDIDRLEKLHQQCRDNGIRERIEAWIAVEKKKLESAQSERE